jgi:legumain
LIGNSSYVKGIGTERVLNSTANDNVFIYFADHGAPGLIAFPSSHLLADELIKTLAQMNGKYNKLIFYL